VACSRIGKWFSYFMIIFGLVFDWAYWFMTALCFRPCDYAHLWDSKTGALYAMADRYYQQRHLGAAAARDCPWFTDNPFQHGYENRTILGGHAPFVVKLEMGIFRGAYTVDEQNQYVFSGKAQKMWLLCIPPLVGWVGLAWIILAHEKVTWFNYLKVFAWHERRKAERAAGDSGGDDDGSDSSDGSSDDGDTDGEVNNKEGPTSPPCSNEKKGMPRRVRSPRADLKHHMLIALKLQKTRRAVLGFLSRWFCLQGASAERSPESHHKGKVKNAKRRRGGKKSRRGLGRRGDPESRPSGPPPLASTFFGPIEILPPRVRLSHR